MPARSEGPSAPSVASAPGAHQGSVSSTSATGAGRGDADEGAPREALAEGVRLRDREPDCVSVTLFVVLRLIDAEDVAGADPTGVALPVAEAPAEADARDEALAVALPV
jgi:hypothetical protein